MRRSQLEKQGRNLKLKAIIVMGMLISIVALMSYVTDGKSPAANGKDTAAAIDSIASLRAFQDVYKVLMSPRCMNCHPAGDVPLQGDASNLHTMFPKRGVDGKGIYAMKCSNCHQPTNTPGVHTPPGNPEWHLPPANMKMVF
ncbi:MAG: hypothetical protein JWQ30_891, partial [Sediminibacterium sp.]|nr:hypothetical protein [Sediminibacterium sp.]